MSRSATPGGMSATVWASVRSARYAGSVMTILGTAEARGPAAPGIPSDNEEAEAACTAHVGRDCRLTPLHLPHISRDRLRRSRRGASPEQLLDARSGPAGARSRDRPPRPPVAPPHLAGTQAVDGRGHERAS